MRILLICILSLLFVVDGGCQTSKLYKFDTISFINKAIQDKRPGIRLYKDIDSYTISEIRKRIEKGKFVRRIKNEKGNFICDSIVLSESELKKLVQQVNSFQDFSWTSQIHNRIKLDGLALINRDTATEGTIIYQIAPPVLFRNGEYCFFYYDCSGGTSFGQGQLFIYKRERQAWKRWCTLYVWNS